MGRGCHTGDECIRGGGGASLHWRRRRRRRWRSGYTEGELLYLLIQLLGEYKRGFEWIGSESWVLSEDACETTVGEKVKNVCCTRIMEIIIRMKRVVMDIVIFFGFLVCILWILFFSLDHYLIYIMS